MSNFVLDALGLFRRKRIVKTVENSDFIMLASTNVGNRNRESQGQMRSRLIRAKDLLGDSLVVLTNTINIDLDSSNYFRVDLPVGVGPHNVSFVATKVGTSIIFIHQNAAGNGTATLGGIKWPGSVAPTITPIASKVDIITVTFDGSIMRGVITQDFV